MQGELLPDGANRRACGRSRKGCRFESYAGSHTVPNRALAESASYGPQPEHPMVDSNLVSPKAETRQ